jgi:hypothetical protein
MMIFARLGLLKTITGAILTGDRITDGVKGGA